MFPKKIYLVLLGLIIVELFVFSSFSFVFADTNKSINSTLYIPSTPTFIGSLILDDNDNAVINEVDLIPKNHSTVWCNGTANDSRGFSNLASAKGVLYHMPASASSPDNYTNHYTDNDCNLSLNIDGRFSCEFDLEFYASPGEWICEVNVTNKLGFYNISKKKTNVTELLALDIANSTLNFGTVKSGENTSSNFNVVVLNNGNTKLDLQLDAFVNNSNDAYAFNCDIGYIPVSYVHYALQSGISYDSQTPLSAPGYVSETLFDLSPQTTGFKATNKSVFFDVGVPSGVAGQCGGFLNIVAITG